MSWILSAIGFVVILALFAAICIYVVLGRGKNSNRTSRSIVNMFEPDNTAPKLTDLINFHKVNTGVKYKID